MFKLFGLGGQAQPPQDSQQSTLTEAPAPPTTAPLSTTDTAPTSTFAAQPSTSPSSSAISQTQTSALNSPVTIQSALAGLNTADTQKFNPQQFDDVELLYIIDNPLGIQNQAKPTGTFGPLPMRTGFDKLLYGCGTAYLGGLVTGGAFGFIRGLQTAQVPAFKVRMNSVLNQMTRYGPRSANTMGILSMSWATLDNGLEWYRGKNDYGNHIGAAFLSGLIFKSTAGLRPAVFTGALLATIVGAYGAYENVSANGIQLPTIGRKEPAVAAA
ncbi:Mitochondrial import inner membrane translocase subunit tim23 [Rhizophlyctis rosea]|uniref:Mitochondrial import inner membrane translocase subunit tim23 n=1 Tax=Rhizophlyctis rosea TaxID=64517 RepID=A0AAD5S8B6_9FUNG|nr:Mitochondrial import inner membrane translocase subunit tim23 [Rhizophlyctis rosea]